MIYAILREQLGNQMFIWATGLALSRHWGCPLKLITSNYGRTGTYMYLRKFPVKAEFLSPWPGLLSRKLLRRELYSLQRFDYVVGDWDSRYESSFGECRFLQLQRQEPGKTLLDGMFQSWRYFHDQREAVCRELDVSGDAMLATCDRYWLDQVLGESSVSVHVRRTDYLHPGNAEKFSVCGERYFQRCLQYCRQNIKNPQFFVFSDDINWAKGALAAPDVNFVSSHDFRRSNISDFVLMANCRHHVISNSTFSWWAAYAGRNGIVLTPSRWLCDDSVALADKVLPDWVSIDAG